MINSQNTVEQLVILPDDVKNEEPETVHQHCKIAIGSGEIDGRIDEFEVVIYENGNRIRYKVVNGCITEFMNETYMTKYRTYMEA